MLLYVIGVMPPAAARGARWARAWALPSSRGHAKAVREIAFRVASKGKKDPNPNSNSLIRKLCCECILESLICRCLCSY